MPLPSWRESLRLMKVASLDANSPFSLVWSKHGRSTTNLRALCYTVFWEPGPPWTPTSVSVKYYIVFLLCSVGGDRTRVKTLHQRTKGPRNLYTTLQSSLVLSPWTSQQSNFTECEWLIPLCSELIWSENIEGKDVLLAKVSFMTCMYICVAT